MKQKYLEKVLAIIMVVVFGLMAVPQVLMAAEPAAYALSGTIGSLGTLINEVEWGSSQTDGTIKIQLREPAAGAEFSSYKLLDIKNEGGMLKVSVPDNAQDFWKAYCETSSTVTVGMIKTKLADFSGEAAKSSSIVKEFVNFAGSKPDSSAPSEVVGNVATIRSNFGFYIIQQTQAPDNGYIASAPVLACLPMQRTTGGTWLSSYTAEPKDDKIDITKKVKVEGEADSEYKTETIAEIGATLEYKIVVDLAKYGSDITNVTYKIVDRLPAGIKYNDGTAAVKFYKGSIEDTPAGTYRVVYDGASTLTLDDLSSNYANLANFDTVEITYKATLDKSATIEDVGNKNEVTLTYTTSSAGTKGNLSATAKVYTHELDITKVDAADTDAPLAGAVFQVYRTEADANASANAIQFIDMSGTTGYETGKHYRVATGEEIADGDITKITEISVSDSGDIGKMKIYGLDDVTYYFKEIAAPTGYNLPQDLFRISPAPDAAEKTEVDGQTVYQNMTAKAEKITNDSGIDLPVTGGMGTILFTAIGLLLMAGAAYFLLRKKKETH